MTTNWKISNIKRLPLNGLVIEVTYIMNFELSGKHTRHLGSVTLTGDPQDPNFIPYEDLTEQIVTGWVQDELGTQRIDEITSNAQTSIQAQIDRATNPEFLIGLPWS
jgi:hypothetical protein